MKAAEMFDLTGKKALVTGSSRGIGRAIALTLAEAGANVIFHASRKSDNLESAVVEASRFDSESVAISADLSDSKQCENIAENIIKADGGVDILVLNASVQYKRPWDEFDQDEFMKQINVNIKSSLRLIQLLTPGMIEKKWGRILVIGSVNQVIQHPDMAIYAATKSAMGNLVKNFARQFAPFGVTVNNLAPGVILTDRNSEYLSDPEYAAHVKEMIPARRFGDTEDCCGLALLLCSSSGGYITGQNIFVSGGMDLG